MILKILKQGKNEIQRLITATGLKGISYNKVKMQGNSMCCGRYCVFFVIMSNLDYTPPQAVDFLTRHKGSKTYHQLICDLVYNPFGFIPMIETLNGFSQKFYRVRFKVGMRPVPIHLIKESITD